MGKVGSFSSEWLEIILGVPQESIAGPILFNVFINDFFLFIKEADTCNFAADATVYGCRDEHSLQWKIYIKQKRS